jgi:iron(II)-dependent oxidoreductase
VAGNVWEWTASPAMGDGYVIRGGSYASAPLYAQCTFLNAAPAELRSAGIGLRVVREP